MALYPPCGAPSVDLVVPDALAGSTMYEAGPQALETHASIGVPDHDADPEIDIYHAFGRDGHGVA
ncbi:MAG: hypothetical protein MPK62_01705 [Alphaproteobacteria bacterium]|nr:hypothetical protein [Alphaproteobacteria bacterium]